MTTTPPEAPYAASPPPADQAGDQAGHQAGPRVTTEQIKDVARLRRTTGSARTIAGVGGGLARHFDIDPVIVRVLLVVLALFGPGIFMYAALWLLLPEDGADRATINLDPRSLSVALIAVAAIVAIPILGLDAWGMLWVAGPVLLVVAAALALTSRGTARPGTYGAVDTGQAPPATRTEAPVSPDQPTQHLPVGDAGQQPPPWQPAPVILPPRPPDPRKKGPILFWLTLALISLALGGLGLLHLSGTDVAVSAYPALALAICAVMLLVGAFHGRAGGIIALGLLLVPIGAVATVAEELHGRDIVATPTTAAEAAGTDHFFPAAGNYTLDLTQVRDLEQLDGMVVPVRGAWGDVLVVVPDDVNVVAYANVDGIGDVEVFGKHTYGNWLQRRQRVEDPVASFRLNVGVGMGDIRIVNEGNL